MNSILDRQMRAPHFFSNTILVLITCQFGYDFEEKDFKVLVFKKYFFLLLGDGSFQQFPNGHFCISLLFALHPYYSISQLFSFC